MPTCSYGRRMWKMLPLVFVLASGCSDDCINTAVTSKDAPDGRHQAVLFERSCGATTGFSTQISVVGAGEQPTDKGNVFIADDDHGSAQAANWGGPWAEMVWLSPDRFLVRHDAKARVFTQAARVSGVQIRFEPVPR